ncbi:ATPase [Oscillospiraceae bacterium MB08-C2-2]|nr:ATPase [Oscillospiraceae bacterium MB08-C2-2]
MNIEEVLDTLDELLDKAWSLPLSGGRCVVDAEKVRDLIDDIRINLPTEIKQARSIVDDRSEILNVARREGEGIIRKAEERAKSLITQEEVVKQAQARAADIQTQTQVKAREMRTAAQEFSDDILRVTEESMVKALSELKSTRQALRNANRTSPPKQGGQG